MSSTLDDIKHLKQFINLYKQCSKVEKLSKINNEESKVFKLKTTGAGVRFGKTPKLLDFIPERESLYDFWSDNEYFWLIPMEIKPFEVYGFTLRGYDHHEYNLFRTSDIPTVLFGLYDFEDFKFGTDTVILTEGIKDALVLKQIHPYVLALNTSGLTQNSYNFIKGLTKRFILVYDNDKAGKESTEKDIQTLKSDKCIVHTVNLRYKDAGTYIKHPVDLDILDSNIKQYL